MGLGQRGREGPKMTPVSGLSDLWPGVTMHPDMGRRKRSRIQWEAEDVRSGVGLC